MRNTLIITALVLGLLLASCGRSDTGTTGVLTPAAGQTEPVLTPAIDEQVIPTYAPVTLEPAPAADAPTPTIDEKVIPTYAPVTQEPGAVLPTSEPIGTVRTLSRIQTRVAGAGTIVESGYMPLMKVYKVSNHWYTNTPTETIGVYAGAPYYDLQQGMVLVTHSHPTDMEPVRKAELVFTPIKAGVLRIIDADGMVLYLKDEKENEWRFDASTSRFIENNK